MEVSLALYKGKGTMANAFIRWWTGSIYSHCELLVDGVCYSSSVMDGGVRSKAIDMNDGKWDILAVPFAVASDVESYFVATDHHKYGWAGLLMSQLLNRNKGRDGVQFCSEWCANAMRLPNAPSYNPASLGRLVSYINQTIKNP